MALNDFKKMSEYDYQSGLGTYNNDTDVFKWVQITEVFSSIDENASSIGISNFTKVISAGNYIQDSILLNSVWTKSGAVSKLDYDDFSYSADLSNPVTGKTWACYNDTSPNKDVYKLVDMTADDGVTPANTVQGLNFTVAAGGSGTVTTNS